MATIERVIVVLRSELGSQLSRAQKEADELSVRYLESRIDPNILPEDLYRLERKSASMRYSVQRLKKAIESLGALQLGDIEKEGEFVA